MLAKDRVLNRNVAIKILKVAFTESETDLQRHQREAQILAGLTHKNILSIYAFELDDMSPFIVMEYLEAEAVSGLIASRGKMEAKLAKNVLLQVADGLLYAHKAGVIHRDLSTANILLTGTATEYTAKIIDFGLAKFATDITSKLTKTGNVVGNPVYMSPELFSSSKVDERSDIYAFGCVMYEMLSGKAAFQADSPINLLYLHKSEYPKEAEFTLLNKEEEKRLKAIILRCIQKDPDLRFQSFAEVQEAFGKDPDEILPAGGNYNRNWRDSMPGAGTSPLNPLALLGTFVFLCTGIFAWIYFARSNPQGTSGKEKANQDFQARRPKEDAAIEANKRVLASQEARLGPDNPIIIDVLVKLANSYDDQDRWAESAPIWKKALDLRCKYKEEGVSNYSVLQLKSKLAECYRRSRRYAEAALLYEDLVKYAETHSGNDLDISNFLSGLASCYMLSNNWEKAESIYQRSLATEEKNGPSDKGIGSFFLGSTGKQEINKDIQGHWYEHMTVEYSYLALCCLNQQKNEEALSAFKSSMHYGRLAIKAGDQYATVVAPTIKKNLESMASIYTRMGNNTEAKKCMQEASDPAAAAY